MLKREQRLNILVFGVFDLPRAHHAGFFKSVKDKFPDSFLIAGIISDETTNALKHQTYLPDHKRKIILESSINVDRVFITDDSEINEQILKAENIDMVCRGLNAEDGLVPSTSFDLPKEKQILVEISSPKGVSISDLREKIHATKQYAKK